MYIATNELNYYWKKRNNCVWYYCYFWNIDSRCPNVGQHISRSSSWLEKYTHAWICLFCFYIIYIYIYSIGCIIMCAYVHVIWMQIPLIPVKLIKKLLSIKHEKGNAEAATIPGIIIFGPQWMKGDKLSRCAIPGFEHKTEKQKTRWLNLCSPIYSYDIAIE